MSQDKQRNTVFVHWNIAGLTDLKRTHRHLLSLFSCPQTAVVALTETWLDESDSQQLTFPGFAHYYLPAVHLSKQGRAAGGISVFVRTSSPLKPVRIDHPFQVPCVCIRLSPPPPLAHGVTLAVCYIPPRGSPYFKRLGLTDPFSALAADLSACVPAAHSSLVVTGDLNAHLGNLPDLPSPDALGRGGAQAIVVPRGALDPACTAHIPPHRSNPSKCPDPNRHGRQLVASLCNDLGLVILNGRMDGDTPGCPTRPTCLRSSDPPQALDLFLAAPTLYPHLTSLTVLKSPCTRRTLSDHWPVSLQWLTAAKSDLKARPGARPGPRRKADRAPVFDIARRGEFARLMAQPPSVSAVCALVDSLPTMGSSHFVDGLSSLLTSQMKRTFPRHARAPHRLWYDVDCMNTGIIFTHWHQCYEAAQLQSAAPPAVLHQLKGAYQAALQEYKRTQRRAKRAHSRAAAQDLVAAFRHDAKRFWTMVSAPRAPPPANTPSLADFTAHFDTLFNPTAPSLPAAAARKALSDARYDGFEGLWSNPLIHRPTPAYLSQRAAAAGLNDSLVITPAEVAEALASLANGKAKGPDGVPAECYKYAWPPPPPPPPPCHPRTPPTPPPPPPRRPLPLHHPPPPPPPRHAAPPSPLLQPAPLPPPPRHPTPPSPFLPPAPPRHPTPFSPFAPPPPPPPPRHPTSSSPSPPPPPPPLPRHPIPRRVAPPTPPHVLAEAVASLFTHIVDTGDYPSAWQLAKLVPIYKGKGPSSSPANYRGIAVMNSLAKCFSSVLEKRLSSYLDSENLRALCQSGFRRRMGPPHNLFTLHHLQTLHCRSGQPPLYVCFVDFVKAFDMVRRDLLWFRLQALGLGGKLLDVLRAMYADVTFRVQAGGKMGDLFASLSGVKQGDPLSPTLFGVFIEALPEFLNAMHMRQADLFHAGASPVDDAFALFYMLFADDLTLISRSKEHMQAMLDELSAYCQTTGMDVNITKSEFMIIGSPQARAAASPPPPFSFRGVPLRHVPSAKYLGVMLDCSGNMLALVQALVSSAQRCRFALQSRLKLLDLTPALQIDLFNTVCRSVMTYGCQVWGVSLLDLPAPDSPLLFPSSDFERVQLDFLRQLTGVGPGTPSWCLVDDCGARSIQAHVAKCVLTFWNSTRDGDDRELLAHTARADLSLMIAGSRACWTFKVCRFLALLCMQVPVGPGVIPPAFWSALTYSPSAPRSARRFPPDAEAFFWSLRIDVPQVVDMLAVFWRQRNESASLPDPLTSPHSVVSTYMHLTGAQDPLCKHRPHMTEYITKKHFRHLCRFRLSVCRALAMNAGRGTNTPRSERLCSHCLSIGQRLVETERHMLYDCPLYHSLRASCGPPLFPFGRPFHLDSMVVLNSPHQRQLAAFLSSALDMRTSSAV